MGAWVQRAGLRGLEIAARFLFLASNTSFPRPQARRPGVCARKGMRAKIVRRSLGEGTLRAQGSVHDRRARPASQATTRPGVILITGRSSRRIGRYCGYFSRSSAIARACSVPASRSSALPITST